MSPGTEPELWDRQRGESEKAYFAFCVYRDQDTPRGYSRVVSELGKSKALIERWGSRWFWRERTRAWDQQREEELRRDQLKRTKAMARRQAQDAEAFQQVLIAPAIAALKKLNTPQAREQLEALPLGDLISLSLMTARLFPAMAQAERLARGAPIQDLSQFLDADTGQVAEGPSPRESYDWMREALIALDSATGGRLALPAGGATDA